MVRSTFLGLLLVALAACAAMLGCRSAYDGVDTGLHVDITVSQPVYQVGDVVAIDLANRSYGPMFVAFYCPDRLETLSGGNWIPYQPPIACVDFWVPPAQVAPGKSWDVAIGTGRTEAPLLVPGTYRAVFSISGADQVYLTHESPVFEIQAAP